MAKPKKRFRNADALFEAYIPEYRAEASPRYQGTPAQVGEHIAQRLLDKFRQDIKGASSSRK